MLERVGRTRSYVAKVWGSISGQFYLKARCSFYLISHEACVVIKRLESTFLYLHYYVRWIWRGASSSQPNFIK